MDTAIDNKTFHKEKSPRKSLYARLHTSVIWAKIFRWEFWPFSVFYFPVLFYWVWISWRARSLFFFTASNPGIEFGGMLGESKDKIFKLIPDQYIPKTVKLSADITQQQLTQLLNENNLSYPLIFKPDIGERGWRVTLVNSDEQLVQYLEEIKVDFLVQEYIPYEIELGVFYYRYPDQKRGTVSSVVIKDMMKVTGDGISSVGELMQGNARVKMHIERLTEKEPDVLKQVPMAGEQIALGAIGNHCLGTTFLNGNHLINKELIDVFDHVSQQIDGFYFGRYDVRCRSVEELYKGQYFKILELNGAGSEPAHIYHPGFSLIQAYKDVVHHLHVLADISILNQKRGVRFATLKEGFKEVMKIRKYNKQKGI
ncbi:MAG: hypothetical protein OCD76_02590 [Reichenbachiella sp.]